MKLKAFRGLCARWHRRSNGPPTLMNIQFDLRAYWAEVRDQGPRNSCLACAASDAHMFAQKLDHPLSAEYLFCKSASYMPNKDVSKGASIEAMALALENHGQPSESEWPYAFTQPVPWTPPAVTSIWHGKLNFSFGMIGDLSSQLPFFLVIKLTDGFFKPPGPAFVISETGAGFGGHAVLAVGMASNSAGLTYILIRNSWGEAWADKGYAWLPVSYLTDKLIGICNVFPISN